MTKPSYEELRITKQSGSPQIADSASGGESSRTAKETRIAHDTFRKACERADAAMKRNNGHQFVIMLKTRCQYCGRSPKAKGRCGGWFQTFLFQLEVELVNG